MRSNQAIERLKAWAYDLLAEHTLADVRGIMSPRRIIAFSLSHLAGGVVRTETGAKVLVSPGLEPQYIAEFFWEKAVDYASGLTGGSGMQQFVIEAHAEGASEPVAQYPLKAAGVVDHDSIMSTEPATGTGLLTQMMRHTEHAMSALARMNEQLMATNANLVRDSQNIISKGYEQLHLTEALVTKAAEGEHAKRLELMQLESNRVLKEKLLTAAPAAVNAIFDREVFPTAMADTSLVESLAIDLDVDDLEGLMFILQAKVKNKEVLGLLFNRLSKIIDEKKRIRLNGSEAISAPSQEH